MGGVGKVVHIRGKTEQRVQQIISILKDAPHQLSYEEIRLKTGGKKDRLTGRVTGGVAADVLFVILTTLCEVGVVTRIDEPIGTRTGRPRVYFKIARGTRAARDTGSRLSA